MAQRIVSFILTYKTKLSCLDSHLGSRSDSVTVRWKAPKMGQVKINFDSSFIN